LEQGLTRSATPKTKARLLFCGVKKRTSMNSINLWPEITPDPKWANKKTKTVYKEDPTMGEWWEDTLRQESEAEAQTDTFED